LIQINQVQSATVENGFDCGVKNPVRKPPEHVEHLLGGFMMPASDRLRALRRLCVFSFVAAAGVSPTYAESPAQILSGYTAQSGAAPVPSRGQQFFTTRHGRDWACATCHGALFGWV